MKTDIEVIDGAIDLISKDGGFCKGLYCSPVIEPKAFCLEGAIRHAAGYLHGHDDNIARLSQVERVEDLTYDLVRKELGFGYNRLCDYNDDLSTTQEDAVLALKNARVYLEQQAAQESATR